MTKEEELRQLEELRRIQAEERAKMNINDNSYLEDSAFTDSAFAPDNSYLNDSAFTDNTYIDSAFTDSAFTDSAFNTQQTAYQQPFQQPAQQAYHQPVQQQPTISQQNQIQQPVINHPVYQQQIKQPPVNQQPVHNQQKTQHQQAHNNRPIQNRQVHNQQQSQHNQAHNNRPMQNQQHINKNQPQQVKQQSQKMRQYDNGQPQPFQREDKRKNMKSDYNENKNNIKNNQMNEQKRKKKKKHPLLKSLIIFLVLILCICGIGIGLAMKALNKMDRVTTEVSKRTDNFKGDVINILLIGQDAREGQGMQRADTIMLCTINRSTHTVSLTSIMRDMYVEIPGYGSNRINAAFAFGGIDLLDQTIEYNLGIKIDGNALVDFGGFMEAMTSVGDLDIELTAEEADYLNQHPELGTTDEVAVETWNLHEGVNTLTPGQVLGYSRIRHVGNSDWDRTNRQRTVIMAVIDKIKGGHILKGFSVLDGAAPNITTDISSFNILKSAFFFVRCGGGSMQSYYLPAEGTYSSQNVDGMAVLVPDIEANKQVLQQYMQGIDPTKQE